MFSHTSTVHFVQTRFQKHMHEKKNKNYPRYPLFILIQLLIGDTEQTHSTDPNDNIFITI